MTTSSVKVVMYYYKNTKYCYVYKNENPGVSISTLYIKQEIIDDMESDGYDTDIIEVSVKPVSKKGK